MTAGTRVVGTRPAPGSPRPYAFPSVRRTRLENGLSVASIDMPGRPLLAASLLITTGAADEPADRAGATVLMARALTEGTRHRSAIEFVEASERLGASIHAEAGWDAMSVSVDVPAARLAAALDLVAEVLAEPSFPDDEVRRLRDERLNDLLQAQADPRRRAEEAFVETVYASSSPYRRPSGGSRATVEPLDAEAVRAELARLFDPARMTLIVGGDLSGIDVAQLAATRFGGWRASTDAVPPGPVDDSAASTERRVRVLDRPGSVQTEIRIGHVGVPRRVEGYHALAVMSAILGGLFNSRLNRNLREAKGYTYGAAAGFDFRRGRGPFGARAAVNTDVTVPAIAEIMTELRRMTDGPVEAAELRDARDYLVGVFPLRFETAGAVVGALAGLAVHDLPDDELGRYRPAIEAIGADDVAAVARLHVRPDEAAIVLVGDADAFLPALEAADLGPISVAREAAAVGEVTDDVD